jgi:hypothetical protein
MGGVEIAPESDARRLRCQIASGRTRVVPADTRRGEGAGGTASCDVLAPARGPMAGVDPIWGESSDADEAWCRKAVRANLRPTWWHTRMRTVRVLGRCPPSVRTCTFRREYINGSGAFSHAESTIPVHPRIDTVGCKSVPDFVEPVGKIPVYRYNRPYDGLDGRLVVPGQGSSRTVDGPTHLERS